MMRIPEEFHWGIVCSAVTWRSYKQDQQIVMLMECFKYEDSLATICGKNKYNSTVFLLPFENNSASDADLVEIASDCRICLNSLMHILNVSSQQIRAACLHNKNETVPKHRNTRRKGEFSSCMKKLIASQIDDDSGHYFEELKPVCEPFANDLVHEEIWFTFGNDDVNGLHLPSYYVLSLACHGEEGYK